MNDFLFFFKLGWEHIISPDALDHILFVTVLSCIFTFRQWKQLLILITAFTIGHFITLALSTYDIVRLPAALVEFLIPVTILLTALENIFRRKSKTDFKTRYIIALLFGLIHGLGFANYIRFMLDQAESLFVPLLGFNFGLEFGQIFVVAIILTLIFILQKISEPAAKYFPFVVSSITGIIALVMAIQRIPF